MFESHVPEHHQRVIRALQSGPRAPDSLKQKIAEMEAAARRRSPFRPALGGLSIPRPRLGRVALAAGTAAVLAIALVVALSLGGAGGPSVVEAAGLNVRPPMAGAPPVSRQDPALLRGSFAGVSYPAWSKEFTWRASGARSDELEGRATKTVFYRHTHHRIGYTVISGKPISPPDDAETINVGGIEIHRFKVGPQDVVMFERGGRTCVLSGEVHDPDTLVKLAAWKGDGRVRF